LLIVSPPPGYASYLGRISPRNAALVDLLLDGGAIIHVRTNVPTTLLDGDTHNEVFGRTVNPLNTDLSPGGSSGGEGALVAMKGSILGVVRSLISLSLLRFAY
jgi:amidase